jgi:hypothetical protein
MAIFSKPMPAGKEEDKAAALFKLESLERKLHMSTPFRRLLQKRIVELWKFMDCLEDIDVLTKKRALMEYAEYLAFKEEIAEDARVAKERAAKAAEAARMEAILREAACIRGEGAFEDGGEIRWPRRPEDAEILKMEEELRRGYVEEDEEELIYPPPSMPVPVQKVEKKVEKAEVELSEEEKVSVATLEELEKEFMLDILPLEDGKLKTHLVNLFLPKVDGVAHHGNALIKQRRKALIQKADAVDGMSHSAVDGKGTVEVVDEKACATQGKWKKRVAKALLAPAKIVGKWTVLGLCKGMRLCKKGVEECGRLRFAIYLKGKEYDDEMTYAMDWEEGYY